MLMNKKDIRLSLLVSIGAKKPPFCPADIFPPVGQEKNLHNLNRDGVVRFSPRRVKTQNGVLNINIYSCVNYDMPCLANGITGNSYFTTKKISHPCFLQAFQCPES